MALTNATIAGAWTLQSKNTALQGRLQVGGLFSQANVQNAALTPMQIWRSGVVPSSSYLSKLYDLLVAPMASPSLSLMVYPGSFIVSRPSQSVYQGFSNSVATVTVADADPTNPRLDLIVARVEDTAVGDGNLRAQIQVITGTPGAIPVAPLAPAGSIPLATARVNALASTITGAQITDVRKSVALNGSVRRLLPGDSLSDPGFHDGELRDVGSGLDRWSDTAAAWQSLVARELEVEASSDLELGTGVADVPGATRTFTTRNPNTVAVIRATYDWRLLVAGTGYCYGEFAVDGVTDSSKKALFVAQNAETRFPGSLAKTVTLSTPGSHSIRLRGHKDASGGSAFLCAPNTTLNVTLYG